MDLRPALNYDVVHLVMSLLSKREVISMMGTCKTLYREGPKFLLHEVTLKDEHDIRSFTQFMAADPYHRIRYLSIFTFRCGRLSVEAALLLRVFLQFSAPFLRLQQLRLLDPEVMLRCDLGLIQAFSRIAYIATLSIRKPDALSFDLLSKMSGFVHTAILDCKYPAAAQLADSNPILALRSLRNTLVDVVAYGFEANVTPGRCASIVFLHVRKLRLETFAPINSVEYARAFPNLASLHFSCRMSVMRIEERERDELAVHRNRNRMSLRECGGWSTLEYLDGTPIDLWVLGLQGIVGRLRSFMGSMDEACQDIVAGAFEELMRDIRVKQVHLDIWTSRAVRDALRTLSRTSRDLEHLGLNIVFDPKEPPADVKGMLDALVEYVARNSLRSLAVVFSCMDILSLMREDDAEMTSAPASADECKPLLHPESLAVRIQSVAPSLRDISLELWVDNKEIGTLRRGDEIPNPEHWACN
ncbi:hypothetical protein K466DRAFT_653173 [Polyporus arcularius HHB13444]|uniref:F-box domain-containing protein n=1 Tax=Polyporus arcularius HHB13444 TaxID=1314778 RepID=A0A5C3PCU2_9APHY|nr:hypothetical protein K466DRAFT_653173 [Polyporus arcularius HHB13444]